eukprot:COSAG01_NODE_16010_length_1278_cov_25.457167_2_plen_28_part_01
MCDYVGLSCRAIASLLGRKYSNGSFVPQ